MTIRRITAPMLYSQGISGGWLISLTAAMDDTAAGLCRVYWQKGRSAVLQPVRVAALPGQAPEIHDTCRRAH